MEIAAAEPPSFEETLEQALSLLETIHDALAPYLSILSADERARVRPVPYRFPEVGVAVVHAAKNHPRLAAAAVGWDPAMVSERLARYEHLAPLTHQAETLVRLITDTRRVWLGEAYGSTLELYRIAKVMAQGEPAVQHVITPMTTMFADLKRSASTDTPDTPDTPDAPDAPDAPETEPSG